MALITTPGPLGSGPATVASLVKAIADPVANEQFDKYRHFYKLIKRLMSWPHIQSLQLESSHTPSSQVHRISGRLRPECARKGRRMRLPAWACRWPRLHPRDASCERASFTAEPALLRRLGPDPCSGRAAI